MREGKKLHVAPAVEQQAADAAGSAGSGRSVACSQAAATASTHGAAAAATAAAGSSAALPSSSFPSWAAALDAGLNSPAQVRGGCGRAALAVVGRVGWCGKAVVYATIGGLACQSAARGSSPPPGLAANSQISASPQGAFVLLGTVPGGADMVVLLVLLLALLSYIAWRFAEGLAGQGYDDSFSSRKNFFKYRLSPLVSGAVYVSYCAFLGDLIAREARGLPKAPRESEGWPATWRRGAGGRAGLTLLGLCFLIATAVQLQGVLTRGWERDYRDDAPPWLMRPVLVLGHLGFAGRAGAFLALAVLFFKDASGDASAPHSSSMVANALQQLQGSRGLRALLLLVGLLLVVYGAFAAASSWAREFPTPPPSRRRKRPLRRRPPQGGPVVPPLGGGGGGAEGRGDSPCVIDMRL